MDRPHVLIRYTRELPHGVDAAYAWLTDYQDDDHTKAGAIIKRRDVVRRTEREVELQGELETLGQRTHGRALVRLYPEEHRWVAELAGGRWVYEYRLTPTPAGCRLTVDYRLGARKWWRRAQFTLLRPLILRQIGQMWDGFAEAMGRELAPTGAPDAAAPAGTR